MAKERILTTTAVEKLLSEGRQLVIMENYVLQLDRWMDEHPGGRLVILHMVGRDATNEINIYHSSATTRSMRHFRIGRLAEPWTNKTPAVRACVRYAPNDAHHDPRSAQSSDMLDTCRSRTPSHQHDSTHLPSNAETPLTSGHCTTSYSSASVQGSQSANNHVTVTEFIQKLMQDEMDSSIRDYPSLDIQTQRSIDAKYRILQERVKNGGFYQCNYRDYAWETFRYLSLFALFLTALRCEWYWTSALFLGVFWHQIMFTAHDAAHQGITQNFVFDRLVGIFIADVCCGLSIGWWSSSHNVHHLLTNHAQHDPDIQNVPLFATCPSFFKSIHSSYYKSTFVWNKFADLAVRYQKYTYYPIMAVARFNLYLLSIHHLLLGPNPSRATRWIRMTELASICAYWFLFGYCLLWRTLPDWPTRVVFVLTSHMTTMPLHVQITLSHWGMPTADLGETESFPQHQLRTTMDVDCPAWLDFIHGGLQFQAVHHLFPRVPRHNLRRLQPLVQEFCKETGIKHSILDFTDGNRKVLGRLDSVTTQLELLLKCQQHMASTGQSGLH